jgi:hypothetical protein
VLMVIGLSPCPVSLFTLFTLLIMQR